MGCHVPLGSLVSVFIDLIGGIPALNGRGYSSGHTACFLASFLVIGQFPWVTAMMLRKHCGFEHCTRISESSQAASGSAPHSRQGMEKTGSFIWRATGSRLVMGFSWCRIVEQFVSLNKLILKQPLPLLDDPSIDLG